MSRILKTKDELMLELYGCFGMVIIICLILGYVVHVEGKRIEREKVKEAPVVIELCPAEYVRMVDDYGSYYYGATFPTCNFGGEFTH